MTTLKHRLNLLLLPVACLSFATAGVWVQAADTKDEARPKGAWQPPAEERSAYSDIIDFNIFRADRLRIAEDVDRKRNPPTPRDTTPSETVEVPEAKPKDPDASWRLSGISIDPEGAIAYIEHTETGELAKIQGEDDFSSGHISSIGFDTLVYTVEDTKRVIHVGETLLGERLRPAGSATTSSTGSTGSSSKPASLEDRLRELRERRAREQGTSEPPQPAPKPAPVPTPEQDPAPEPSSTEDAS